MSKCAMLCCAVAAPMLRSPCLGPAPPLYAIEIVVSPGGLAAVNIGQQLGLLISWWAAQHTEMADQLAQHTHIVTVTQHPYSCTRESPCMGVDMPLPGCMPHPTTSHYIPPRPYPTCDEVHHQELAWQLGVGNHLGAWLWLWL